MKKAFLFKFLFLALSITSICLTSCKDEEAEVAAGLSFYDFSDNRSTGSGYAIKNTTLKAIELPCQNNNTLRMYYSDSAATLGFPARMNVVSNGRAGRLRYNECYIEISTSATDTYLTTGTDNWYVSVGGTPGNNQSFDFPQVLFQHWTSMPLNDFVKISGHLQIK